MKLLLLLAVVCLAWDHEGGATYNVYSSPSPFGPFTVLTNVAEKEVCLEANAPAMFFLVTATNNGAESEFNQ